jgi:phosphoribosylcarboxyaminoimidazole (NCAIR) mutase
MPVVPDFEKAYDLTCWILKAHPTPDELAEYLKEIER